MSRREIPATDLRLNLDRIADPKSELGWTYLYGCEAWEGWLHDATREERCICPVCRDHPKPTHYCLHCDRTGLDGKTNFPGEPIGSRINEEYHAEPTSYHPHPDLRGGTD